MSLKKKLIPIIALPALAIATALILVSVSGSKANSNDFTMEGSVLTKYNGSSSDVKIPGDVTEIGKEAFAGNTIVQNVTIPSKVKKIDYSAFNGCTNLKTVLIPDSVEEIGDSAFNGCTNLESVIIGRNLSLFGSGVFSNCPNLSKVTVDSKNPSLCSDNGGIYNKDKTILYQYINNYPSQDYNMPNTVKIISRYAFTGCKNLKSITFSTALDSINQYALYNCGSLENAVIYNPVRSINLGAFENCSNLRQVTVPVSVSTIHDNAFNACSNDLTLICDSNSSSYTYAVSKGIKTSETPVYEVKYDNSVITDNKRDDSNDPQVKPGYEVVDRIVGEFKNKEEEDAALIDGTLIVSDRAFISLDGLKVNKGKSDGLGSSNSNSSAVSDYAFYKNKELSVLDFSGELSNVTAIGMLAFARSTLTEVTIPEGITQIGYGAFYHCDSLNVVDIPGTVTFVGQYAFDHTPWYNSIDGPFVIVGDGVLYSYKGNDSVVNLPDAVKYIAPGAFRNHTEIEAVNANSNLVEVYANAFTGCNIKEITGVSDNVKISDKAFE